MGRTVPYSGKPKRDAARVVEDLYERRWDAELSQHRWSDLASWEIFEDIKRELLGTNKE